MSGNDAGGPHGLSGGGIAAKHDPAGDFKVLVGPSTGSEFNVTRLRLIPIACWRVDDIRFDFDSSFVLPGVRDEMPLLSKLVNDHAKEATPIAPKQPPPISIFGQADPVGDDSVNKPLSGRRASAIYGMLTRRTEIWEDLFSNTRIFTQPAAGDNWGARSIQIMLNEVAGPVQIDGEMGPETQKAVRDFQNKSGLAADGNAGPATRKKIFLAYMDALCVDGDGSPFQIDRAEGFLAHHGDQGGKADFQGCSAFNPLLIFSERKNAGFEQDQDKTGRNAANEPNRRVMALLFRPGSRVDPGKWPCPRAKEGVAGCIKRFWSDGEKRRGTRLPDKDRRFEESGDTFACRFYQRISDQSPCDRILQRLRVRLYDGFGRTISFAPFAAAVGDQQSFAPLSNADEQGIIVVALADIAGPATSVRIKWGFKPEKGRDPVLLFSRTIFLISKDEPRDQAAIKKLANLGYDSDDQTRNILGFQLDYGSLVDPFLAETGELDERTLDLLDDVYEQSANDLRNTKPGTIDQGEGDERPR